MAIEFPKDGNGEVIPFNTTMMYRENGSQFHVTDFFYEVRPNKWFARSGSKCIETNKLQLNIRKKAGGLCLLFSPTTYSFDDCEINHAFVECDGSTARTIGISNHNDSE